MSKYGVLHCTAYKVPDRALEEYWKMLYGKLDSPYAISGAGKGLKIITYNKVEVSLLDGNEETVAVMCDHVPSTLLTSGAEPGINGAVDIRELWNKTNVFDSFFVRPMFVRPNSVRRPGGVKLSAYSTKAQRRVTFTLTDAQLGAVKKVKVRFVAGKK